MKAIVDRCACIGCELCVSVCPQVFVMDDDILAAVILEEILLNLRLAPMMRRTNAR